MSYTDCANNNNKYWVQQLLRNNVTGKFWFFLRYGRIGEKGRPYIYLQPELKDGLRQWHTKYNNKTLNVGYTVIEKKSKTTQDIENSQEIVYEKSKLDPKVYELINFIYDKKQMELNM